MRFGDILSGNLLLHLDIAQMIGRLVIDRSAFS